MGYKVYVVEDDESIRMLLEVALKGAGFEPTPFSGALEALTEMTHRRPDACVLDATLEGMTGVQLLETIRQTPQLTDLPVMMLTTKPADSDRIIGIDAGADDYMTKPFSVLELCARVRALTRRSTVGRQYYELISGALRLRPESREVTMSGSQLELTFKEFDLLHSLMANAGRAVPRDELLRDVWGYDFIGETRTLDMHVGTLRHKLGDKVSDPLFIKTVRSVGYRFIAPVVAGEVAS